MQCSCSWNPIVKAPWKSASTQILGIMALQKLSVAEHSNISNALCSKGLQTVAGANREIVGCHFQSTESLGYRQINTTIGRQELWQSATERHCY